MALTKRVELIERRTYFLAQLERTQKIVSAVKATAQKFGCSEDAAWQDAQRLPKWIDTVVKIDDSSTMIKRIVSAMLTLVPYYWSIFSMAMSPKPSRTNDKPRPNLNAALGALNSITRLYVEVARFLQSVGIVYKVPEKIEIDHADQILVEVADEDEADILRKATEILARNESRKLH